MGFTFARFAGSVRFASALVVDVVRCLRFQPDAFIITPSVTPARRNSLAAVRRRT